MSCINMSRLTLLFIVGSVVICLSINVSISENSGLRCINVMLQIKGNQCLSSPFYLWVTHGNWTHLIIPSALKHHKHCFSISVQSGWLQLFMMLTLTTRCHYFFLSLFHSPLYHETRPIGIFRNKSNDQNIYFYYL